MGQQPQENPGEELGMAGDGNDQALWVCPEPPGHTRAPVFLLTLLSLMSQVQPLPETSAQSFFFLSFLPLLKQNRLIPTLSRHNKLMCFTLHS